MLDGVHPTSWWVSVMMGHSARRTNSYSLSYATSNQKITAVTVSATGNTCTEPIPVTFPARKEADIYDELANE
jgi:hypothetical protein